MYLLKDIQIKWSILHYSYMTSCNLPLQYLFTKKKKNASSKYKKEQKKIKNQEHLPTIATLLPGVNITKFYRTNFKHGASQ